MSSFDLLDAASVAVFMAAADRWCGGGIGWEQLKHDSPSGRGFLRGRPNYYAAPFVLALGYGFDRWPGFAVAALWLLYRGALGFPDGTLTGRDRGATWERHLWAVLCAVPLAIGRDLAGAWAVAAPFVAYVVAAVVLAKWNGDRALKQPQAQAKNINATVETLRGLAFGLAWVAATALSRQPQ